VKVKAIVESKNPYLIATDHVVKPEDFHKALVVEIIMSMIIKGVVGRGAGGFWREYLGLTPQILQAYNNVELQAQPRWPFRNIHSLVHGQQQKLVLHRDDDAYALLIDRSITLNWNELCNKFVKGRLRFLDATRTVEQRMNDATKLAKYMMRLILLQQTRSSRPTANREYTITEILRETLPLRRSVTYLNPTEFVREKLHRNRERGHFPALSNLFEIIDHLVTEINLRRVYLRETRTFLSLLVTEITNGIKQEEMPLRFTYGPNTEYIVILSAEESPSREETQIVIKIWKEALTFASKYRRSFAALQVDNLILVYLRWKRDNPSSRTSLTKVAEAIQQLFDSGALNPGIRIPNSLKMQLLQHANRSLCK
jgi:hypothetical protein